MAPFSLYSCDGDDDIWIYSPSFPIGSGEGKTDKNAIKQSQSQYT